MTPPERKDPPKKKNVFFLQLPSHLLNTNEIGGPPSSQVLCGLRQDRQQRRSGATNANRTRRFLEGRFP